MLNFIFKATYVWLILCCHLVLADTYPKNQNIDITHYAFTLELSDETDEIQGKAVIDVSFKQAGVERLRLDLISQSDALSGKGMLIKSLMVNGNETEYSHGNDVIIIQLSEKSKINSKVKVTINYRGIPATGLIIGPNKHGDRTFFSDNWPNKARNWLPTVDHPSDKATCEFIVTAPNHYQVIFNGLKQEESNLAGDLKLTHWKQSIPISNWLYVLGVADFAVQYVDEFDGKSIQTWVYPQDREAGFYDFAVPTKDVLKYYSENVGPFAYEKLANIQSNSVGGGMEAASAILYGDNSVTGERTSRWRNVVIHEIAHQWFGNSVTESDWDEVWLSEGITTYFTLLYIEYAYGREEFVDELLKSKVLIKEVFNEQPDFRIVHDNIDDMSKVTTYGGTYLKGAWVLHMLRSKVGDEAFWQGIRSYYKKNYNSNSTVEEFRKEMEEASGDDLTSYFEQWLYWEGNPELNIVWSYSSRKNLITVEVEQTQSSASVFKFPLEIKTNNKDGSSTLETIELNQKKQRFQLRSDKQPESIEIDPNTILVANWELNKK